MGDIKTAIEKCSIDRIEEIEFNKQGTIFTLVYFVDTEGKPIIPINGSEQIMINKINDLEERIKVLEGVKIEAKE